MSDPDSRESDYEHERAWAAVDGWLIAQVDQDCANPLCGLNIHAGDPVVRNDYGHCHPLCDIEHAMQVDAEMRRDAERES